MSGYIATTDLPLSQFIPSFKKPMSPGDQNASKTYDFTNCLASVPGDFIVAILGAGVATVTGLDGTVPPTLVVNTGTIGANAAGLASQVINAFHSGGTSGVWYQITWTIVTNSNRTLNRSAYLYVTQL